MNIPRDNRCRITLLLALLCCGVVSARGQTNTSTGNVTLSNTTWQLAMTNATGDVPLMMTLYNFGPGGVVYGWGGTNAPHYLGPGTPSSPATINIGPVTPAMATMWWRCASNAASSWVRMIRTWQE